MMFHELPTLTRSKRKNAEVDMRALMLFALFAIATCRLLAEEQNILSANAPPASNQNLLLREIRYDGKLTDSQAKFVVDIDAESPGKSEASIPLFDGDLTVMPAKLPPGLRLVREGRQYRLVASKPGRYKFKLEVI